MRSPCPAVLRFGSAQTRERAARWSTLRALALFDGTAAPAPAADQARFADGIAASVGSFLESLRVIADQASSGQAISLLLLQISEIALTGARLGVHRPLLLEPVRPRRGTSAAGTDALR